MVSIREQKLLYHLTALSNLPSIFEQGLLPRSGLADFIDVADHEILIGRERLGLQHFVPFHFFAGSPFDGRVQQSNREVVFVFITVRRVIAESNNWVVMPRHPLARETPELLSYREGIGAIDWASMDLRDYSDERSKSVCMAECLSPVIVEPKRFFSIYVPNNEVEGMVSDLARAFELTCHVDVNASMFVRSS